SSPAARVGVSADTPRDAARAGRRVGKTRARQPHWSDDHADQQYLRPGRLVSPRTSGHARSGRQWPASGRRVGVFVVPPPEWAGAPRIVGARGVARLVSRAGHAGLAKWRPQYL